MKQSILAGATENTTCVVIGFKNLKNCIVSDTMEYRNYVKKMYSSKKHISNTTDYEEIRKRLFNKEEDLIKLKKDENVNFLEINYLHRNKDDYFLDDNRPLTTYNNFNMSLNFLGENEKFLTNTIESKDIKTEENTYNSNYNLNTRQSETKNVSFNKFTEDGKYVDNSGSKRKAMRTTGNFLISNGKKKLNFNIIEKSNFDKKIFIQDHTDDIFRNTIGNLSSNRKKEDIGTYSPPITNIKNQKNFLLKSCTASFSPIRKNSLSSKMSVKANSKFTPRKIEFLTKESGSSPLPKIQGDKNKNSKEKKNLNFNIKIRIDKLDDVRSIFQSYNLD